MAYIPQIGLWMIGGIVAARRREEESNRKNERKDIDMGAPQIIRRRKRVRMCIKAQSDNPCHSALECGHGEPHICHGNDCMEPGHFCTSIKEAK